MFKTAAIIAIIIAIIITGYLFIFTKEQYSSLYIIPESYQNQTFDDRISFTYGVICSEEGGTDYDSQIFLNNELVHTEQFRLNYNEYYEKNEELLLTENVTYPAKVQVILNSEINTEEVHFWLEKEN
ncbi:hypothetical protein [Methanogenium sp. MK-MG]|uniref:hypothetical protein n=1 Tax=Methanogenium sp. MK-MG TaxID=2599926 RepID=UPI0013EA777D|nr:hypothetical protein [Methanogenium sp. MK-MG]